MRFIVPSAIITALLFVFVPAIAHRAEAGSGILHCQTPDGTSVYTNKACGAVGARSVPLSGALLSRIASEHRHEAKLVTMEKTGDVSEVPELQDSALARAIPVRRPLAGGCATSPQQLALDLAASVQLGDVNRVAESFDWAGMESSQARRVMARLEQVAQRSILDTEYFDGSIGTGTFLADAGKGGPNGASGLMQVTFDAGDGRSIVDFQVRRDQGCYFLRY